MSREPFAAVDAAWLRMDDPTNLMMITGTMILRAPIEWRRLRATIEQRLLRFDRFRQRVIMPQSPLELPCWEDDPHFDLDWHLKRAALPPPANQAALQEAVSFMMSAPLDYSRPLWQIHLIERYGRGSALIVRLHHCIADGIALAHILRSLTDGSPDAPWPDAACPPASHVESLDSRPAHPAINLTQRLWREGQAALDDPERLLELTNLGVESTLALGRLILRWPDPPTPFKGKLSQSKRAVWSKPMPLQQVKAVGHTFNATLNDVMLSTVAGALGDYMRKRGEAVADVQIRAVVPVNLRPLDVPPDHLGNQFGLVFLSLPIGVADPVERLREVKQCMDALKRTPEAVVVFAMLNVMGAVPKPVQDFALTIVIAKGTAVVTNVAGPPEQLYLAGAPLDTIMFWVPQSGHLGLGVSILSYAGRVWLGIATDEGLVPDPETLVKAFQREFAALSRAALKRQARRGKATRPMHKTIDRTIGTVDELLKTCQAKTRAGQPCKRRALPGSKFCRVHQK